MQHTNLSPDEVLNRLIYVTFSMSTYTRVNF